MSRDMWKQKYDSIQNKGNTKTEYKEDPITWSPPTTNKKDGSGNWYKEGSVSKVRIVPYKKNSQDPFIETYMYYKPYYNYSKDKVAGKVSPITFGEDDPIAEFIQMELSGERKPKDEYKALMQLQAKPRYYVPIIVRGEEEKGVRFWGIGKELYKEFVKYYMNEQYGDLHDPKTGRDIEVTYKTSDEVGSSFGETSILVDAIQTLVTQDQSILELIKNQPDLYDSEKLQVATYDELQERLERVLGNSPSNDNTHHTSKQNETHAFGNFQDKVNNVTQNQQQTQQTQPVTSGGISEDEFDDLFGDN